VRLLAALLSFCLVSLACRTPASQYAPVPRAPCPAPKMDVSDWDVIDRRTFAFRLPPGFRQIPVQGIDSYVEQFEADGGMSVVTFDFGWYSGEVNFDPGMYAHYDRCIEVIGGRTASLMTAIAINPNWPRQDGRQVAAAGWRNVRDLPDTVRGHDHLTLWAETRDRVRFRQLLAMLRTVEFRPH
jgi:hypothetical protein